MESSWSVQPTVRMPALTLDPSGHRHLTIGEESSTPPTHARYERLMIFCLQDGRCYADLVGSVPSAPHVHLDLAGRVYQMSR